MIFDWHLDLAWNALEWDRDLTLPVMEVRRREREAGLTGPGRGTNTVTLPALRAGNVAVVSATLLARHDRHGRQLTATPKSGWDSVEAASAAAAGQLAYYRTLERRGWLRILDSWPAFKAHVAQWQAYLAAGRNAEPGPPVGAVISMEGADPILSPDDLGEWYRGGLRILSLSHYGNGRYSHGTDSPGPLHPQAPALLRAMERLGVILDVTHLADDAMTQAFGVFDGVVIASHSNCRALVPGQRQLRDTDILEIAGRGGVIGVAMDNWMLDPECGQTGTATVRRVASLEDVANHIDYVCQLTGSAKHSALGTDLDGGFGVEQSPRGLETIADLPRIGEVLTRRGYSTADVRSILWENWYDLVRRAWHASSLRSPAPTSAGPPAASNRSLSFPTFSENPS